MSADNVSMESTVGGAVMDYPGNLFVVSAPSGTGKSSLARVLGGGIGSNAHWAGLTSSGGSGSQCGWLKDKYGVSWQIVPKQLGELLAEG